MPRRFVSVTVSRLRSQEPQGRVLFRANPIVIGVIVIGVIVGASLLCIHVNLVFMVSSSLGNGGGSVVCCDFSHCPSSRMCGGVAWDWSVSLQGAGGRWRGECPACWEARIFFLGREKNFPGRGTNFPVRKGQISHSCRGRILSENGWSTGATAVAETGAEGVVCSYL